MQKENQKTAKPVELNTKLLILIQKLESNQTESSVRIETAQYITHFQFHGTQISSFNSFSFRPSITNPIACLAPSRIHCNVEIIKKYITTQSAQSTSIVSRERIPALQYTFRFEFSSHSVTLLSFPRTAFNNTNSSRQLTNADFVEIKKSP